MLVELVQLGNDGLPLMALTLAADEEQDNKTTAVEISTKRWAACKTAQSGTVKSRYNGLLYNGSPLYIMDFYIMDLSL